MAEIIKRITLSSEGTGYYEEKKSRFLAWARPVLSDEEAMAYVADIKKEHRDARHVVFAYELRGGEIARYSDDGEPQGTAGVPILEVIRKGGFSDAVIVVVRYFGGTLLGAGGLVRAYTAAASDAVCHAGIAEYRSYTCFSLSCTYPDYHKLTQSLADPMLKTDGVDFAEGVTLTLALPDENYADFAEQVTSQTAGRDILTVIGHRLDKN